MVMNHYEINEFKKKAYLYLSEEDYKNFTDKELIDFQKQKLKQCTKFIDSAIKMITAVLTKDEKKIALSFGMDSHDYAYNKVLCRIMEESGKE
jgi:hypothetical protein